MAQRTDTQVQKLRGRPKLGFGLKLAHKLTIALTGEQQAYLATLAKSEHSSTRAVLRRIIDEARGESVQA